LKSFTLKGHSDTSWKAKIASAKAVGLRTVDVHDTLLTLAEREEKHYPDIARKAVTLFQQLKDFILFFFSFMSHLV
jgi:hypothetical protein